MKKQIRKVFFICLSLYSLQTYGQISFQKTFWSAGPDIADYGQSVVQAGDEGYFIAGVRVNNGGAALLKRTDKYGNEIWTKYFSTPGSDDLTFDNIQKTSDNNLIMAGVANYGFSDSRYYDAYLTKIDTMGNVLWHKTYGGNHRQRALQVKETSDKGFILGGWNEIYGTAISSFYLVKTDDKGDTLWTRTYHNGNQQYANAVEQTSENGFVIVGSIRLPAIGSFMYVIKTDGNGDTLWTRALTEFDNGAAYDVTNATNGNIIITGYSTFNGCSQPILVELDLNGRIAWHQIYSEGPCGWSYSVSKTRDNGYALFGLDADSNVSLIKTDQTGTQSWFQKFDENLYDYGYNVRQTTDGGFILTGVTTNTNIANILLIKTGENGTVISTTDTDDDPAIVIYPNPAGDHIKIEIPGKAKYNNLKFYNILGRELAVKDIKNKDYIEMDISSYSSGIYFINIDNEIVRKVVKN